MGLLENLHPKILITGSSGFLGKNLGLFLMPFSQLTLHVHKTNPNIPRATYVTFDLANEDEIRATLDSIDVDWVIHLAAVSNPDECDRDRMYSYRINVEGTRHLLSYCNDKDIPLIYFSSDMVFDGSRGNYSEDEEPNPINFYTETKYIAEQLTLASHPSNLVCGIALAYGKSHCTTQGGFIDKILAKLSKNQPVPLFNDQYRTALFSGDLGVALKSILTKKMAGDASCPSRIFHITGKEHATPYEIGLALSALYGFDESLCIATPMDSINLPVKRSKICSLNNKKTLQELNYSPKSILNALQIDYDIRLAEEKNIRTASNILT